MAAAFAVWASSEVPVMESGYEEVDEPVTNLLGQVLGAAKPRPPAPQWNEISVQMPQALFPAYNGEADPERASQRVADFLEGTVD